jgi:predicted NodU family carbamoyl transferase
MHFFGNDMLPSTHQLGAVITLNHHITHAYSAFFTSEFDDAAVLVIDGLEA